ncbi:MAG: DUF255 domain-containing protein [Campylobacterota bacterium]
MRKILIYMVLFFATSLMAAEVNWAKDFESGLKQAKAENKPMLFVISRDTCKYCIILKNTTFKDKKVTTVLNKDFVAVTSWINENDYVPERLFTPGLPGIWFLLPSGEPMFQPLMGALGTEEILHYLKQVKAEFEKIKNSGK